MDQPRYGGDISLSDGHLLIAPKALPTLPGIGGDGVLYQQFDSPSVLLELEIYREPKCEENCPR